MRREANFFIANSLTQLKRRQAGISDSKAYDDGLEFERVLREKFIERKLMREARLP